jgi:hypothetical protein
MYADGVEYYNAANSTSLHNAATPLWVGALKGGAGVIHHTDGWIDDVRVIKGTGLYPSVFTPPLASHTDGEFVRTINDKSDNENNDLTATYYASLYCQTRQRRHRD